MESKIGEKDISFVGDKNVARVSNDCDGNDDRQIMDEINNSNRNNTTSSSDMELDTDEVDERGGDAKKKSASAATTNHATTTSATTSSSCSPAIVQPVFKDVTFNYDKNLIKNQWGNEHLEKKLDAQVLDLQKQFGSYMKIPTDSRSRVLARRIVNGMRSDYNTHFLKISSTSNRDSGDYIGKDNDNENNYEEIQYNEQLEFVAQLLQKKCEIAINDKISDDDNDTKPSTHRDEINNQDNTSKHPNDDTENDHRNAKIQLVDGKEIRPTK